MTPLTTLPKKFSSGHQIRPRGAQRVNPIKAIQDREWRRKQLAAAAAAASNSRAGSVVSDAGSPKPTGPTGTGAAASSSRLQCPNKACKNPNVVDGTCRTCGRVADDSNIVAEVSFGENAQGAAVVQGSFLGADQGGIRPMAGIGHRRVAGNGSAEARERSLREARLLMTGYAHQLHIPDHTVNVGFQYYKLASSANFVQGRKIQNVVAVCLYAACRKSTHANPCKIMLIDLADLVKEEVFFLGRTFKKLLQTIEVAARDVQPIYVEDLIFRFASKLEFDTMTNKVAETAVRLVQRMDRDWMVMGRRPAGICGACLIMAARIFNFRRTVREVVYIAKVTMATLQMRLDEFKELPSAKMTVEEFLAHDFLTEEYDPPSIYKKSDEYQAKLKEKREMLKRKRGDSRATEAGERHGSIVSVSSTPGAAPQPPKVVDADGFAVPALPPSKQPTSPAVPTPTIENTNEAEDEDDQLAELVQQYGDGADAAMTPLSGMGSPFPGSDATDDTPRKRRRGPPDGSSCRTLPVSSGSRGGQDDPDYVDDAWRADEENLEMEMTEAINSPGCIEHARAFASAEQAAQRIMIGMGRAPSKPASAAASEAGTPAPSGADEQVDEPQPPAVSDSPDVEEDEFKDDPEVQFCLLSEEEAAAKEKIWMNENRAYLRMRQEKEFRAKIAAANGSKKQTRRRLKKPKIGEGQITPASTPGAAAVEAMERRGFSKRINYEAMRKMLDRPASGRSRAGSVSMFSSYSQSRAGSSIGSVMGDEEEEEGDGVRGAAKGPDADKTADAEDDYDAGDNEVYEEEEEEIDPFAEDDAVEEEDEVEEEIEEE
ncbi:transcription factor IIIB 90 kDa subunit [Sporothrix schenckii 1099-18]|uniref:Transcription factor IIIB 90 kDa subunit n=1 Tax=Sporothrix schenckii 1099-18 TaxID=1397361 RepID=A0A0F2MH50_SPOSC|nr:transcription factor IIIB 90 kDa subunit [Sporothrix schenckii 1099-18]KJR88185.1 transcription factor IIIB 90 kDa subunit [Sporothrix schenckii 1099-18]